MDTELEKIFLVNSLISYQTVLSGRNMHLALPTRQELLLMDISEITKYLLQVRVLVCTPVS